MPNPPVLLLLLIGSIAGLLSGVFGIGGGVVIMPALVYFAGFDQHRATGTSLAVLLPPIGLGAALEYYRHGAVDIRAALIVAVGVFAAAWLAAMLANRLPGGYLRLAFGLFVIGLGVSTVLSAVRTLGWV